MIAHLLCLIGVGYQSDNPEMGPIVKVAAQARALEFLNAIGIQYEGLTLSQSEKRYGGDAPQALHSLSLGVVCHVDVCSYTGEVISYSNEARESEYAKSRIPAEAKAIRMESETVGLATLVARKLGYKDSELQWRTYPINPQYHSALAVCEWKPPKPYPINGSKLRFRLWFDPYDGALVSYIRTPDTIFEESEVKLKKEDVEADAMKAYREEIARFDPDRKLTEPSKVTLGYCFVPQKPTPKGPWPRKLRLGYEFQFNAHPKFPEFPDRVTIDAETGKVIDVDVVLLR